MCTISKKKERASVCLTYFLYRKRFGLVVNKFKSNSSELWIVGLQRQRNINVYRRGEPRTFYLWCLIGVYNINEKAYYDVRAALI